MDLVRDLISLGRNAREEKKIKVRQPIKEIILDGKNKDILSDLTDLIKEELNVKEIVFEDDLSKYMNFVVKPNFKEAGKVLGSKMKDFTNFLSNLNEEQINKLRNNEPVIFEDLEITNNLIDIKIISKEGFNTASLDNNFIILNTTLDGELIKEGYAREFVSKIQNLRKEKDFDIENRIKLSYNANDYFDDIVKEFNDYIKKETLSLEIVKDNNLNNKQLVNDIEVAFDVEKIK